MIPLTEAIRRMTSSAATDSASLSGMPKQGYFADVVVFDPATRSPRRRPTRSRISTRSAWRTFRQWRQVLKDVEHRPLARSRAAGA